MHEFSLDFLRCVGCISKLDVDIFCQDREITEGMLECKRCGLNFPIIDAVPIIWDDFSKYLSSRTTLGGKLFRLASTGKMKKFVKDSLSKAARGDDQTALEKRWGEIYQRSKNSKFYAVIKSKLRQIPPSELAVEYGCSIGLMSDFLARHNQTVFGIDKSYSAIQIAKKSYKKNLDFAVADSLSALFGDQKFDFVLALNVLELIEPLDLLEHVSKQISKGYLVISDPYDFDRGKNSVKKSFDEKSLRKSLCDLGFSISNKTQKPSYIPWALNLNPRCTLNYKVDLVVAKK